MTFHVDTDGQVDRLGAHSSVVAYFDVNAVEIKDRVHGVERAGLPELHILADGVRDVGDEGRWHLDAAYLLQMVLNLSHTQPATGARLSEALSAKWIDVNRQSKSWRIPATKSKSGRVRMIPLNDSAIEDLDRLGTEDKFDSLFINLQTKEPLTAVNKVWGRLRVKAGLPDLRLRDLRHQHASFLVNAGHTLYAVQKILGPSDAQVTERYAQLSSATLLAASNSAPAAMRGASNAAPKMLKEDGEILIG